MPLTRRPQREAGQWRSQYGRRRRRPTGRHTPTQRGLGFRAGAALLPTCHASCVWAPAAPVRRSPMRMLRLGSRAAHRRQRRAAGRQSGAAAWRRCIRRPRRWRDDPPQRWWVPAPGPRPRPRRTRCPHAAACSTAASADVGLGDRYFPLQTALLHPRANAACRVATVRHGRLARRYALSSCSPGRAADAARMDAHFRRLVAWRH